MAGKKITLSHRTEASTLLEVVVSMVLIVLVAGIAMSIFGHVSRLSLSAKKAAAYAVLEERMELLEYHPADSSASSSNSDISIEQEIQPYLSNKHLQQVHLTARDAHHNEIASLDKIIISP
jgi:type II secretory pathway component PulJ